MAQLNARTDLVTSRRRDEEMSDKQLVGFLGRKILQAMNDEDGDLSDTRSEIFNRYNGDLYGYERDGYSKFTTREVLEAVEWAKPALLRIFLGSDRVVAFDAVGPEDEDAAAQETDVVNHTILKANGGDGFLALYEFITDALMFPTSYIKAWVQEEERTVTRTLKGIPVAGLAKFADRIESGEVEILEQDNRVEMVEVEVPPDPQQGTPGGPTVMPMEVFDLKYKETTTRNVLKIMGVPGEEALVDNDLVSINLDHGDFVAHRVRKSYSELVREGYDPEELDDVGTYEDYQWNDERTNRLFYEDEDPDSEDEDDWSMRQFWVHECFAWVDYDGAGVAQYRRIVLIGAKVFENEEVDYQPMVAMSSIVIPHKHNGISIAQLVEDLQELLTTLTRQLLDNIYRINIRRKVFSEDALVEDGSTMEAMLNVQAEWIPVRGLATEAIAPEVTQPIVGDILPVIQDARQATSMRSGIAPENNVDPDVLQQTTMGAFMGAMEKAGERLELIARIMAETGIKQLFRKVHQLCRQNPDIVTAVKLRGEWVDVDPEGWEDRTDMTVNVGLGFNNKQTQVGLLTQLLAMQREALPTGLAGLEEIYNTLEKLVEASGVGAVEQFFKDPTRPDFQPPPPQEDGQQMLFKAQAEALGRDADRSDAKTKADVQQSQQKMQQDGTKAALDAQTKHAELQHRENELTFKHREMDLKEREMALREREQDMKEMLADADTSLKAGQTLQAVTQAGKAAAETASTQQQASDEHQAARDILADLGDLVVDEDDDDADTGGSESTEEG